MKKTSNTSASYELTGPMSQKILDDAILRFITKKLLPVTMVENEHFREFVMSMFDS